MSKQPNLIYVFADQLRYSSVGYNGDTLARTPNIDELSKASTVMDNCCSGHPVCAPYRASLFTGKYTTSTGMVINEIRINPNHKTFANVLTENGYDVSYIGKWHMYAAQLGHHFNPKNSYIPQGADRLGFDGFFAAYNFHHRYFSPKAYYHLNSPEKIYYSGYEPDCQTDMAIEKIREHKRSGKPFALFLSIGTPHNPWEKDNVPEKYYNMFKDTVFPVPPNYKKKNDPYADGWAKFMPGKRKHINDWKRVYYAMTANLDENVGRISAAIDKEGISDNTIFVFTSDHGEMFGAQGRHAKNIFYEEACRVPFLIKWGDKLKKGICDTCFNTVDIMPTLLSMMSLPVPNTVQGTDISGDILRTGKTDNPCLMMGTGPTAMYGDGKEWRAVRTKRFTYAVYKKDSNELLFDNINDPYQLNNLASQSEHAQTKNELKNIMYAKMEQIGDNFEKNSYYKKHWIKNRIILEELH
ncbi:MAG: sulfatase [Clostridia bacterium]|nr:sulfatase [Clostridia bacterium]